MSQPHNVKATCATIQFVPKKAAKKAVDPIMLAFGQRLRTEIDRSGLTQTKLAKLAGVDQGNLSGLVNGTRGVYAVSLVRALRTAANAGCDVSYIITGKRTGAPVVQVEGLGAVTTETLVEALELLREQQASKADSPPDVARGAERQRRKA